MTCTMIPLDIVINTVNMPLLYVDVDLLSGGFCSCSCRQDSCLWPWWVLSFWAEESGLPTEHDYYSPFEIVSARQPLGLNFHAAFTLQDTPCARRGSTNLSAQLHASASYQPGQSDNPQFHVDWVFPFQFLELPWNTRVIWH